MSSSEPPAKKTKKEKALLHDADRAEKYLDPIQPGRVHIGQINYHEYNRGGQGIMPMHVHLIARNVCVDGTSKRRYHAVKLVRVPEAVEKKWIVMIRMKARLNSLLPNCEAMSHTGPFFATLRCTHFVGAHQLIKEGSRRYLDQPAGFRLVRRDDDHEGKLIQSKGVAAIAYSPELWNDTAALLAVMREDNLDADVTKGENELESFGLASRVVAQMSVCTGPEPKVIKQEEVMEKLQGWATGAWQRMIGNTLSCIGCICRRHRPPCC